VTAFAGVNDGVYAEWMISEADARPGLDAAVSALDALGAARLGSAPAPQRTVSFTATLLSEVPTGSDVLAGAPHMMAVAFAAPPDEVEELDGWYAGEHTRMLLRASLWTQVRVHRVESITGADWSRLALHALADASVIDQPEVAESRETPARRRLAARPWFFTEGRPVLAALQ
jgi:hypothetical protein